ncbi:MAG TPA: RNA polymerase sigma factor [Falsiroseomonas sp.]|jgi:RNA polymerase sigma-70 factor (ECF subfamily)|nr:RNA polymerase sigma factor [Falsiroseomonas sp.]
MEDEAFVARLRAGEERAYRELVRRHHTRLVRLAQTFCGVRATAEEVVQDSWVAVFTTIDTYAGTAPLRSWIAGIVVNKARARGVRDGRMRSFSDFLRDEGGEETSSLDESRFSSGGGWAEPPLPWDGFTPERDVGGREVLELLGNALDTLPPAQRAAVLLRDVEGQEPQEVCRLLEISEGNLRVLLHRARTKLRAKLDAALAVAPAPPGAVTAGGGQ